MRDDFCVFILTHGRPDLVVTHDILRRVVGYTGKIYLVCDDEDKTLEQYVEKYGDEVLVFSKDEIGKTFDQGDNFGIRNTITFARNVCWDLAKQVGCRYFIQFDDDYFAFGTRINRHGHYGWRQTTRFDEVLEAMIEFYESIPALSIAFSQGGDHFGGSLGTFGAENTTKRKAMNSFLCSVDRPFKFRGSMNEDVNTYTSLGRRGSLFLTIGRIALCQRPTQSQAGGITEMYLKFGTYTKAMHTVMHCPSSILVYPMGQTKFRLHHRVKWNSTVVKIVHERHRKPDADQVVAG